MWLVGQGGTGIQTAPAAGRLAAAAVLGEPVPDDLAAAGVDVGALGPASAEPTVTRGVGSGRAPLPDAELRALASGEVVVAFVPRMTVGEGDELALLPGGPMAAEDLKPAYRRWASHPAPEGTWTAVVVAVDPAALLDVEAGAGRHIRAEPGTGRPGDPQSVRPRRPGALRRGLCGEGRLDRGGDGRLSRPPPADRATMRRCCSRSPEPPGSSEAPWLASSSRPGMTCVAWSATPTAPRC